jgi:hypothetical protein
MMNRIAAYLFVAFVALGAGCSSDSGSGGKSGLAGRCASNADCADGLRCELRSGLYDTNQCTATCGDTTSCKPFGADVDCYLGNCALNCGQDADCPAGSGCVKSRGVCGKGT